MSANETQVGGTHYNKFGDYQHWDMSWYFQLDPMQYQITKYVMRHKDKNGMQDLKKAQHFLAKYIELLEKGAAPPPSELAQLDKRPGPVEVLTRPRAVEVETPALHGFTIEGYYGDMTQMYKCRGCGTSIKSKSIEEAMIEHGTCSPRGYVAQAA